MESPLVEDPVLRQRYRFSRAGDVLTVDIWVDPGGTVPNHLHPTLEERWDVIDGTVTFRVDGDRRPATAGDSLVAQAGVKHSFENTGDAVAQLRATVTPALDLQEFLEEGAELNRTGRYTRRGIPKGLRAAIEGGAFLRRYRDTTLLMFPPPPVQRALLWPLARFARG